MEVVPYMPENDRAGIRNKKESEGCEPSTRYTRSGQGRERCEITLLTNNSFNAKSEQIYFNLNSCLISYTLSSYSQVNVSTSRRIKQGVLDSHELPDDNGD